VAALRTAVIPWYHSIAELAAFPLVSESALGVALTRLDPNLKDEGTKRLWRDAEKEFVRMTPSLSLDELVAMRDVLWFRGPGARGMQAREEVSLAQYLRHTSGRFLRTSGSVAVPDFSNSEFRDTTNVHGAHDRSLWRWVSFALPPDLLLAARENDKAGPEQVDTLTPSLAQRLRDGGYVETHLHLGAALDFPLFWLAVLKALGEPGEGKLRSAFASPGACLEEGVHLADWLMRAAIARYLLGAFLNRRGTARNFSSFLWDVQERIISEGHGEVSLACINAALADMCFGRLGVRGGNVASLTELQTIYAWMTSIRSRSLGEVLSDAWKVDPLAEFLPDFSGGRTPEIWLVSKGLEYLEGAEGSKDGWFERLFWQVIRVRCLLYRHVVQRPMTPGLQWFIRFFARLKGARRPIRESLQLQSALRNCGAGMGLRAFEARVGPRARDSMLNLIATAEGLLRERRKAEGLLRENWNLELGFIVHFSRDRGGGMRRGEPSAFGSDGHPNPHQNGLPRYRYAAFYNEQRREAVELASLLVSYPLSLEWIRGVDLCTDEMGVPLWVMGPLVRHVRDAGEMASRVLRRRRNMQVPPLRIAVHAGEDFVHLLTGMRLVDEAIEWLHLRPGDRLGHGLALGIDAARWASRAGRVIMPKEVRLFDLVWEWNWRGRHGGTLSRNRHLLIEREVADLTERIFEEPLPPLEVDVLVRYLHNEGLLRQAGFPNGPVTRSTKGDKSVLEKRFERFVNYLTRTKIFQEGCDLVWVDPMQDVESLEELQKALRKKVGEKELVVEVNPSSNLLIGHLADVSQHPLWRLRPHGAGEGAPPLALTIGSDDPITFATNLRQEFQILYDSLILSDHSAEQAEAWIEGVRKAGLTARFTVPWSNSVVRDLPLDYLGELERQGLRDPP
jgi:hypothetical protein